METNLLEFRVLSYLRKREAYLKFSPLIKEGLFESKYTKYIYKLLIFYHKRSKAKSIAPLSSLFALVNANIKENEAAKYQNIIRKIKKYPLQDEAIAEGVVKKWAKKQVTKMAVMEAVNMIQNEDNIDIEKVRQRFDEALMIDAASFLDDSYDYFSNPMQRLETQREQVRIRTGLSYEIDESCRGGLAAGELGLVMAPTKVGKTLILLNISHNAMKQDKKVLYLTLELSWQVISSRMDQLVTRKEPKVVEANPQLVIKATKRLHGKFPSAGFKVKDAVSSGMSPANLAVYLERLRKDYNFDILIVDQIAFMHNSKEYKERRHELSAITIALRRLGAQFNIPVWSACQAGRMAGARGETTLWDVAEDIGLANWSDFVLAVSQDDEEKKDGIMWVSVEGNRIGAGNPRMMMSVDYKSLRVKAAPREERKDES